MGQRTGTSAGHIGAETPDGRFSAKWQIEMNYRTELSDCPVYRSSASAAKENVLQCNLHTEDSNTHITVQFVSS